MTSNIKQIERRKKRADALAAYKEASEEKKQKQSEPAMYSKIQELKDLEEFCSADYYGSSSDGNAKEGLELQHQDSEKSDTPRRYWDLYPQMNQYADLITTLMTITPGETSDQSK